MKSKDYYQTIAKAIHFLTTHRAEQPDLNALSAYVGLSEYHLQRIFSEWVGISPKQYLQYLTKDYAKKQLKQETVMEAATSSGLSSSSRLHDLMIQCEAMTPGEYKNIGKGLNITYGCGSSPFGSCFIAVTNRGICQLAFFDSDEEYKMLEENLHLEWGKAKIVKEDKIIAPYLITIFGSQEKRKPLKLLLKGSPFQLKVWEALLSIPEGDLVTYQEIATAIEKPTAVRATASAIARNHIAYLIPCHRVIRQNGEFGQYRWHKERKQAMIGWESARKKK